VLVLAGVAGFLAVGTFAVWFNGKFTIYDLAVPLALVLLFAGGRFANRFAGPS
jgi:hypothetical protein